MSSRHTATAEVLKVRNLYDAGVVSRPQAISALVSLGYMPSAASAIFGEPERARLAALAGLAGDGISIASDRAPRTRYPTNMPVGNTESLLERVRALVELIEQRVKRLAHARNLVVFDGSIFDQLVHEIIVSCLPSDSYRVLCALRPCMTENLKIEVTEFAENHGYEKIGYSGDCAIDFTNLRIDSPQCSNINSYITDYFANSSGTLFVGGISTDDHLVEMEALTELYGRSILQHDEPTGDVRWETITRRGHTFSTVLLLHGLMPYEVVACAMALLGTVPKPWHVPECYLPCYFEVEKRRVRTIIEHCSDAIAEALSDPSNIGHNIAPLRIGSLCNGRS